jgi:hypothetical protein
MANSTTSKKTKSPNAARPFPLLPVGVALACALCIVLLFAIDYTNVSSLQYSRGIAGTGSTTAAVAAAPALAPLDKSAYDKKLLEVANATTSISAQQVLVFEGLASSSASSTRSIWPVKTAYPNAGALLPFNRIVAYYGNFYSTGMGVLGEYPEPQVIQKLQAAVAQWKAADPSTPVIPAIDYIAVTAQGSAGPDGKYRLRMPDSQIDKAVDMANQVNGIVILDVQVGLSSVETEVPLLQKYLEMPNVHLALDPEFAMQTSGRPPGTVIGTLDAKDINWAANYLANLVQQDNLPPKILVVHRFTEGMVTNYKKIIPLPQVQVVMDMDGWGFPAKKVNTYQYVIAPEPVEFTGFKLFYKADLQPPSTRLLTPAEVLKLKPQPVFIQYQ